MRAEIERQLKAEGYEFSAKTKHKRRDFTFLYRHPDGQTLEIRWQRSLLVDWIFMNSSGTKSLGSRFGHNFPFLPPKIPEQSDRPKKARKYYRIYTRFRK